MFKRRRTPDRWWNATIEITVPFDTFQEARDAFSDERTLDLLIAIFGPSASIGGHFDEVVDGEPIAWTRGPQ